MKAWRTIGFAGLALLALAALSVAMQVNFPGPTGSYAVGRTTLRWVDNSRPEVLTPAPADFREIVAEVWYPAEAGTGTHAPYFPNLDHVAQGLVTSGSVTRIEAWGLRLIRSNSLLDAQLSDAQAAYPVVLVSPGNETNVEFYSGIADDLASHGYMVVGINHPYDVGAVELGDGSVAQFAADQWPREIHAHQAFVAERVAVRTQDVRFTLDQLEALNASGQGPFTGRLDLAHVGIMGHSLGGITASEACRADPRLLACLNLDGLQPGGPFSVLENTEPPEQPFMFITKEPVLSEHNIAQFEAIPSGSYRVVIYGAGHQNFEDGPVLLPSLLPLPNKADRILALTRAYTLAFFDQALKGQFSSLLAKPLQDQEVLLEVYGPG